MVGSDEFGSKRLEKPSGHSSVITGRENQQICICLSGELTRYIKANDVTLEQYNSVWLDSEESHREVNESDDLAAGLSVSAPGRGFNSWTDRTKDGKLSGGSCVR